MADTCEICGEQIKTIASHVEIDGAVLRVCPNCAKLGRPMKGGTVMGARPAPVKMDGEGVEPAYELDPDYNLIVRRARERLGLSHEELGRMMNVKPSVISHIETKRLVPDMALARKLMHHLKVNILVSREELEGKNQG